MANTLRNELYNELEDTLYGENQDKLECVSVDEYNVAAQEFAEADLIAQLRFNDGFVALLSRAEREADLAISNRASFICKSSKDKEKQERLDSEMEHAVSRRDWIRQTVENAASVQKPVLKK